MGSDVIDLSLSEPPDGWNLEQFNVHIERLIKMYKGCYLRMDGIGLTLADKIHERIWTFRDRRSELFFAGRHDGGDTWLLIEGKF